MKKKHASHKETRVVRAEPDSNLIVKIVNNSTHVLQTTNVDESKSSRKMGTTSNIRRPHHSIATYSAPAAADNWPITTSKHQNKSVDDERMNVKVVYESFSKSASKGDNQDRLDVQLSKLSLDNPIEVAKNNTSNHQNLNNNETILSSLSPSSSTKVSSTPMLLSNASHRTHGHRYHRPMQNRWFRHKRANNFKTGKDEFEFANANEFWEDEEFLLNIGENNNIKLADSDGHDV